LAFLATPSAHAIRPFVTDDAHTVGAAHLQLESYWRRDHTTLEHWVLPAFGPTDWLELTVGGAHGLDGLRGRPRYAVAGPLAQAKFLLHQGDANEPPSVAAVVGTLPPLGRGSLEAPGWGGFGYLALTQAFIKEDDLMFHVNVGISAVHAPERPPATLTWGVGTQVETVLNIHLIGEIFYGDPYGGGGGGAYQTGIRIIFNDHLQVDSTFGGGLWRDTRDQMVPFFVSSGIRLVSHDLW